MITISLSRFWDALPAIAVAAVVGLLASCGGGSPDPAAIANVAQTSPKMRALAAGLAVPTQLGAAITLAVNRPYAEQLKVAGSQVVWVETFNGYSRVMTVSINGGSATELGTIYGRATDVTVDGADVYWSATPGYGGGTISKVPLAGGVATILASVNQPYNIAADDTFIYWSEANGGPDNTQGVRKVPKNGGAVTDVNLSGYPYSMQLVGGNLYVNVDLGVGVLTGGRLVRMNKNDGAMTEIVGPYVNAPDLASDGTFLYWTENITGSINRVPLIGGAVDTISSGRLQPFRLTVFNGFVYWTEIGNDQLGAGSVQSVAVTGGQVTEVAAGLNHPSDIFVDATGIYWTEWGNDGTNGSVKQIPFIILPPPAAPTISNIAPISGFAGIVVTINGTSFGTTQGNSVVNFGATQGSVSSWSDTQISAAAPAGSGLTAVTVTTAAGISNAAAFTYQELPPPALDCPSQVVTWTFGNSSCSATYLGGRTGTNATLSDIVGPDTGTVTAICTNGVLATSAARCITEPPPPPPPPLTPVVDAISPSTGTGGSVITISGSKFGATQSTSVVNFGTQELQAVPGGVWSDTRITLFVPNGLYGPQAVSVTTSAGTSNSVVFTPIPTRIEEQCSAASFADYVLLPLYKKTCDLIAFLRASQGFQISHRDASTDQLFNWLQTGANEDAVWLLVSNLNLGSAVDTFIATVSWDSKLGSTYVKRIKTAASAVGSVEKAILAVLRIGNDVPAVQFALNFSGLIADIEKFFDYYNAVAVELTKYDARNLLLDYINIRCGAFSGPCGLDQERTLPLARQQVLSGEWSGKASEIVCVKGIFKCKTGRADSQQMEVYANWLETEYQAHRLISSPLMRQTVGKAIAKLAAPS